MGLSSSEDRMIVAGVVLAWYRTVSDGQMDGQTESIIANTALCIARAMLTRCKKSYSFYKVIIINWQFCLLSTADDQDVTKKLLNDGNAVVVDLIAADVWVHQRCGDAVLELVLGVTVNQSVDSKPCCGHDATTAED